MSTMLPPDELDTIVEWVQEGSNRDHFETTIRPMLEERCLSCHDGSNPHLANLAGYDNVLKTTEQDTGADIFTLVRVSHIHLFGISFIFFILGLIFSHAYVRPVWFKCLVITLPFVKKATLSQFDGKVFLLDGHNNPGFSGGPVVFAEPFTLNYKVAAVISGYKAVQEPVYAGGQPSNLTYLYNTGIIVSHSIDSTMEMIRANPIGFDLNSAAQPHRPPDALSGAINYLDLH